MMGKQQSDRPECGGLSRSQGQRGGVVLVLLVRERGRDREREGESICLHGDVTPRPAASSLPLRVIHRPFALSWRMNPNNSFNQSASILSNQFARNDFVASFEEQREGVAAETTLLRKERRGLICLFVPLQRIKRGERRMRGRMWRLWDRSRTTDNATCREANCRHRRSLHFCESAPVILHSVRKID